jgi:hypothetical protein
MQILKATGETLTCLPKTGYNSSSVFEIKILTTAVCYLDVFRTSQERRGAGL